MSIAYLTPHDSFSDTFIAAITYPVLPAYIVFTEVLRHPMPFPSSACQDFSMLISFGKVFIRPPGVVSTTFAFEDSDPAYYIISLQMFPFVNGVQRKVREIRLWFKSTLCNFLT